MENAYRSSQIFHNQYQRPLPNATAVLVLGIISIVGGLCYGVVGFVCGIIAVVLANRDLRLYDTDISQYSASSASTLRSGRVCAIIGLCFGSLWMLMWLFLLVFGMSAAIFR